jgi:hypothetical protein
MLRSRLCRLNTTSALLVSVCSKAGSHHHRHRAVAGFINDLPDGTGAAAALGGAAERRIDAAYARPLRGTGHR